jgi:hypothetical protein
MKSFEEAAVSGPTPLTQIKQNDRVPEEVNR